MKRLSQFMYKLLLTILVGIFISISTFPGKVIAFDLRNTPPQYREQARQQEAQLRKPRLGVPRPGAPQLGEAPPAPRDCPKTSQPVDFQKNLGLDYIDSDSDHVLTTTLNVINPESFTLGDVTTMIATHRLLVACRVGLLLKALRNITPLLMEFP